MLRAFLLTRQWRDEPVGLSFEYWASSARGPLKLRLRGQRSVFFVPEGTELQQGKRRSVPLQSMQGGAPVEAVYFARQRELVAERERLQGLGSQPLEADVRPQERFLMERFITGGCEIEGTATPKNGYLELVDPVLRASKYQPSLRVASIDIETVGPEQRLLSIALHAPVQPALERVYMVGAGPEPPHTHFVADESALITRFCEAVREFDPDVLIGWNVIDFDLATLVARGRALGTPVTLGRDGSPLTVRPPKRRNQPTVARIVGRVVLDGITMLRASSRQFESFALEDVAQHVLGRGKTIAQSQDRAGEIVRLFERDKASLAAYNLEDCRLVSEIFAHTDLLDFLIERQQLTGLSMDRPAGAVAAFDYLYLPRLHRAGFVAPSARAPEQAQGSPGGYVMESEPGLYDNVLVLDFKSLYPSIIRTFCIDPLGMALPGQDAIDGFEGARFSKERHVLPGIIERLWRARDDAKRRGDAARSQAIKILMNSFYGVLGTPNCRFFSPRLASSITRRGHEIIRESRALLEREGERVIYGDTDSLFVHVGAGPDRIACTRRGQQLADRLNHHFTERLSRQLDIVSRLEVEFETHYARFLMPAMRGSSRGSKKRYAGLIESEVEVDGRVQLRRELVFKGLEAVRSDWTLLAREFQRELYRKVFLNEPYEELIRGYSADLLAGKLDDKLVYRKRLRRDLADYSRAAPPHVQAARKAGVTGRSIEYVMTVRGPEPYPQRTSAIDYGHYLRRQLAPAADSILHFCGTDFMQVGGRQLSLF